MAKAGESILTPQMIERICALARDGRTERAIARECGFHHTMFGKWLTSEHYVGREPYATFAAAYCAARHESCSVLRARIAKSDDWRAAAWLLERQSAEYGQVAREEPDAPVATATAPAMTAREALELLRAELAADPTLLAELLKPDEGK